MTGPEAGPADPAAGPRPADPLPHAREAAPPRADEVPSPSGRWGLLYGLLVAELVLIIFVCHWLTVRRP
jgi:hypothetical protein